MAKEERRAAPIRSEEVWLIDEDGTDLGFVSTPEALRRAQERGLDLVAAGQMSSPPRYQLARAGDQQAQAARAARIARGATVAPKEIRVRVLTGAADLATRQRSAATMLQAGHRVKIRVEMDPGQRSDPRPARAVLEAMVAALAPAGTLEKKPFSEKGAVAAILAPR